MPSFFIVFQLQKSASISWLSQKYTVYLHPKRDIQYFLVFNSTKTF